jgi:Det1 complexing ubiquitin ligase
MESLSECVDGANEHLARPFGAVIVPATEPAEPGEHSKAALLTLPSWTAESFSCFRPSTADDVAVPYRYILTRLDPSLPSPPPPQVITTDTTKCLIKALRAKPDSVPLQSAAIPESLAPVVSELQKTQSRQQRAQIAKNASRAAVTRRRQLAAPPATRTVSNAAGISGSSRLGFLATRKAAPGTSVLGREDATNGSIRSFDRMTFGSIPGSGLGGSSSAAAGSIGTVVRPKKRPRTASGWGSLTRDRRQICIRVSLAAAVRLSPSRAVAEMHRIWTEDPSKPQRVTSDIRRELAESVKDWSIDELMAYVDGADMCGQTPFSIGCSTSRLELAMRVRLHLLPDPTPQLPVIEAKNNGVGTP